MPSSHTIRSKFLNYFEKNGHKIVSSSSLIPFNDPTLLFTNAGMNQFKDVFLGNEERPYRRAVTSQKCMRVSGKHNDFREVGHSTRHHTFFEMLGNFSFGDYFKDEAVAYAWELVTKEYELDPARLWATVYKDDDEAYSIWAKNVGLPEDRILRLGEKDNFWAMGETGPCGPCSEIHYDFGESPGSAHSGCDLTCPCGRWVEIWNLVFMQYNRNTSGKMVDLPSPSIDTGMGLERITTILQGKTNNFDTDLFVPILQEISEISGLEYGSSDALNISMRIIADHARAATFVVSDGQYPGNDKRGYVLRKIIRRAVVHGRKLKIEQPFIFRVAGTVMELMSPSYPQLDTSRDTIAAVIKQEEQSFADTLSQGLREFEDRARAAKSAASRAFSGRDAFFLYDTCGIPLEIIEELAEEADLVVDEGAFNQALEEQRARSRQDHERGKATDHVVDSVYQGQTEFVGYQYEAGTRVRIVAIVDSDQQPVLQVEAPAEVEIVLDQTPFYAEAGGQVGDTGHLSSSDVAVRVRDTQYRGLAIAHRAEITTGKLKVGDSVLAEVDFPRRRLIMKNHTATHLLHAALREILGPHVKQAGSLVAPDRLRFDFTHYAPLSAAQMVAIEDEVNSRIWDNTMVETEVTDLDHAMESGAMALFGEKYQEKVRVVSIPGFSRELCGGTHVSATGTIGVMKIVHEGGIAAGVRRLEAVTGPAALERLRFDEDLLDQIQTQYKVSSKDFPGWLEKLHLEIRTLQKTISEMRVQDARTGIGSSLAKVKEIAGVKVLADQVSEMDRQSMRALADEIKQKLGSGVVILGTPQDGKVALIVMVSDDLSQRIPAAKVVREVAALVGGSGGGKPQLAEAGGKDLSKLADAIERSYSIVEQMLGQ